MAVREAITSAVTRYYMFNGLFRQGEEDLDFGDVDASLIEVGQNATQEFAGTARLFTIELESFDPDTQYCEIIAGFTVWPYEDNEAEIALIMETLRSELEKVGFVEDDNYYMGDGPDIR